MRRSLRRCGSRSEDCGFRTSGRPAREVATELGLAHAFLPGQVERELQQSLRLLQPGPRKVRAIAYCFCEP